MALEYRYEKYKISDQVNEKKTLSDISYQQHAQLPSILHLLNLRKMTLLEIHIWGNIIKIKHPL